VITEPPLKAGAVQETVTCALPATPLTEVGASGAVASVTEAEASEAALVPALFVAVTVKVYDVPFVRPVTVQLKGPAVQAQVAMPGTADTRYPVIAEPPSEAGAVQETVTCALPATPLTAVGTSGEPTGAAGVAEAEEADGVPVPAELVAVTVKV
jgi:hypothetical protein